LRLDAGIVGRDRDVLVAFYTGPMGFALAEELRVDGFGTVLKLRRDDARLKLFFPISTVDAPIDADPWYRPGGWRYAALTVDARDDLHALADAVADAGGRVVLAPTVHRPGAETAVIADPEGNHWELLWEADGSDRGVDSPA
jgi:catechol 2,3-dioxygenase-like lactoylglutathione lyase family enzyme